MAKGIISLDIKQINRLRHPYERTLYVICAVLNTVLVMLLLFGLILLWETVAKSAYLQNLYITVVMLFVAAFYSMGTTFAQTRVYSVRVNREQFPLLYEMVEKHAETLQLPSVPGIYIRQENGVLNAFAAYFWGRNYVKVNTEIIETGFLEHKDLDAVSFVIGHELAHICLHHTRFWYNSGILLAKVIPILGTALSRAQEYSCDRIAAELCPDGRHGLFLLLLGKHLYKNINVEQYLLQAENTKGWFEFFVNINATHPVDTRRVLAVYKPEKRGGIIF